jgi:hypothetical protein
MGLLAELVQTRQEVHRDSYVGKLIHRGWHATFSYVFGDSNSYDGAMADHRWDPGAGHWRAPPKRTLGP